MQRHRQSTISRGHSSQYPYTAMNVLPVAGHCSQKACDQLLSMLLLRAPSCSLHANRHRYTSRQRPKLCNRGVNELCCCLPDQDCPGWLCVGGKQSCTMRSQPELIIWSQRPDWFVRCLDMCSPFEASEGQKPGVTNQQLPTACSREQESLCALSP
jgi:hypothetical protein